VAWPFGCPARFTDPGGAQTRYAQTLLAFSPVSVALLGHATRPKEPDERKARRQQASVSVEEKNVGA